MRRISTVPRRALFTHVVIGVLWAGPAFGQVDQERATQYFKEAAALCAREGGRLWGVSLCGPIVIADPARRTIATSEPPPDAPRPATLGYANAAVMWGDTRWTTLVWPLIPSDERARGILITGDGWTLTLAPGWTIRPGPRQGDFVVVAEGRGALPYDFSVTLTRGHDAPCSDQPHVC